MKVAEIGCHLGGTTFTIAEHIKTSHGRLWAIDSWLDKDIYRAFMDVAIHFPNVFPIRDTSLEALRIFPDGWFDLVFIDANHLYSYVKQDIQGWMPKVRKDGILCGHDCEQYYTKYNETDQKLIAEHKDDDNTPFTCHPGVVMALYDMFRDDYQKEENTRIWYKKKA